MRAAAVTLALPLALSCCLRLATPRASHECAGTAAACFKAMAADCPAGVETYVLASHPGNPLQPDRSALDPDLASFLAWEPEELGVTYYHLSWDCKGAKK